MPYLAQRPTKKLVLPSNSEYWVEIYTTLRYADIKQFGEVDEAGKVTAQADLLLQNLIASWNLDDDSGVLPITQENIDQLDREDVELIVKEIGGTIAEDEDAKKNSLSEPSLLSTDQATPPPS